MKKIATRVPNYTQIYFPYSTETSVCHGSVRVLAPNFYF